jgi:DNA polymerase
MQFDLFDDTQTSIIAAEDYPLFKDLVKSSNCKQCELHRGRRNIVIDRGTPTAKIMVIGEAPGEKEDSTGSAFVGRAGKLLDEILKAINLDTEKDVLIVNIVKCRPPGNRAPLREEVNACMPYLHKQIKLVQPQVIVLLGAVALKHMIPGKKGFEYPGVHFMVLYHPAYLLYDPRKKKDMWEHVKRLETFLQETPLV